MNYLAAGGLIVTRVQSELTDVPPLNIRAAVSLEWIVKNPLHKSVSVVFFDDIPEEDERNRIVDASLQLWLVVVTWKNVADPGVAALNELGELLDSVKHTLQGWSPSNRHGPLARKKCPYRKTDRDGFTHFPLAYATRLFTTGNP